MINVVLLVIRIARGAKIAGMTGETIRRRIVVACGMATQTGLSGVSAGQRKFRQAVVKGRRLPGGCTVAGAAIMVERVLLMIRIFRRRKLRGMTGITQRGGIRKSAAVTAHAGERRMRPRQRKSRRRVIKPARLRRIPRRRRVALRAKLRKVVADVVRVAHAGILLRVTGVALGRRARIPAGMAARAINIRVAAGQQEPGRTVVEIDRPPRCRRMTLHAIVTEAIADVIGIGHRRKVVVMTGEAVRRHTRVAVGVAAGAIHRLVRAGQGEARRRVIEG